VLGRLGLAASVSKSHDAGPTRSHCRAGEIPCGFQPGAKPVTPFSGRGSAAEGLLHSRMRLVREGMGVLQTIARRSTTVRQFQPETLDSRTIAHSRGRGCRLAPGSLAPPPGRVSRSTGRSVLVCRSPQSPHASCMNESAFCSASLIARTRELSVLRSFLAARQLQKPFQMQHGDVAECLTWFALVGRPADAEPQLCRLVWRPLASPGSGRSRPALGRSAGPDRHRGRLPGGEA
jgi:hypothetical protein